MKGVNILFTQGRVTDFPIEEIALAVHHHALAGSLCFQKWTCEHCGSRQMMEEPNTIYLKGKCQECDKVTVIRGCNYMKVDRG